MGCYPLGKMVTKAFRKCRGKERGGGGASRVVILSPPPSYLYSPRPRTMMKSVTFANNTPIIIIPPDSSGAVTVPRPRPKELPTNHPNSGTTPAADVISAGATTTKAEPTRIRLEEPSRDHSTTTGADPNKAGSSSTVPVQPEPAPARRDPPSCYVMSPLPRGEDLPRRREYFSAEYSYYPTPIREGIYNIATDPNRLTTIFSEENPNACSIV